MSHQQRLVAERYRLTSQIGIGGMGRVWLARDEVLRRDVAVKEVVPPAGLSGSEREKLFARTLREAQAAGRLNHPNVVAIYDVFEAEGRPWIVMELVRSRSLYQVVQQDGPLPPRRAAELGLAILSALRAAHRAGVWHRDVKPGNVLLADDGRVVLTDFGLATFDGDGLATRAGIIYGSAQYVAPERASTGESGPASDLWSLGATLYAAVEGRSPYARRTPMATLMALATAPPDPPRQAGPLRPVLVGLLRKDPRHRMTPAEVERHLLRIVDRAAEGETLGMGMDKGPHVGRPSTRETGPTAQVPSAGPRSRWALWWMMLVVALALAAPTVVVLLLDPRGPTQPATVGGGQGTPASSSDAAAASVPSPSPPMEAMRVQACVVQPSGVGTPLAEPSPAEAARDGLLPHWARHRDSSGFDIHLPGGWEVSRIGALVCFRDPTSAKTVAVYSHGSVTGAPLDLMVAEVPAWRTAAGLTEYQQLGMMDVGYTEGAADLEYSYRRGSLVMHGVNRMLRMAGQVYTIYFLATEVGWPTDREVMNVVQPSFAVSRPAGQV